jgi:hypothetical protein
MNKQSLAKAILTSLKAQTGIKKAFDSYLYLHDEGDLEEIFLDGPVDLLQLADSLLDYLSPKDEQPLSIAGVESCAHTPIVKIVWGDGVVTYAHFTQEAEVVHMMGRETVPKRFGVLNPEEALAS